MRWVVAALMLAACNHGNNYMEPSVPDMATAADLDMATLPDLAKMQGPTCGEIAQCALGCGQDFACIGMCAQGADPQTLQSLGALLLCAGVNCITIDADAGIGGIDMTQLFMCVFQSCGMELSMCPLFGGR
jgi:hypothetical protein